MTPKAALAHIRQICCLGLGGEAIMPTLLRELHDLVPCDSGGFFWVDESGEMTNLYAERLLPCEAMAIYFTRFYDGGTQPFRMEFTRRVKGGAPLAASSFADEFYRSDYYNLIWRHFDAHHALYAIISEHGRPLGQLSLYRARKDPPFNAADQEQLGSVVRYIAHGLTTADQLGNGFDEGPDGQSGLLIFDGEGQLIHASPQGRRLLFLATYARIARDTLGNGRDGIPPALVNLCHSLDRVFQDGDAPPPVLKVQNSWGSFVFRAYWMEPGAEGGRIGVTVQHRELLPVALVAGMKPLPLSPKQREVALLLALGKTHQNIAQRLNVSLNTANYHVKQVYDKLDAHDRQDVLKTLLPKPV